MARFLTQVALSIKGDRIEKGSEIELTAEEVAAFDPADIVPVSEIAEETPADGPEIALEEMTSAQLKARAKELGLSGAGSAADIRERIQLSLDREAPADEPEGDITSD